MANVDFNSDDVLGYEQETDPESGRPTGTLRVMLKDGTEREFRDEELLELRDILQHYTQPEA